MIASRGSGWFSRSLTCLVARFLVVVALVTIASPETSCALQAQEPGSRFGLVIHGGGGVLPREEMTPELEAAYREALSASLRAGYAALRSGRTAVDAVEAAIRVMEDSPLFNAGKGSSFNIEGHNELDASIMDGRTLDAGGVAIVKNVRNPITLARMVMERTPHVLMAAEGAERLAREQGLETVPPHYFWTERRWESLQRRLEEGTTYGEPTRGVPDREVSIRLPRQEEYGTVGAAALDMHGDLAAGTSTGGRMGKLPGRVGDSPIIGAGTYADNATAAISSTGLGEFVLRVLGTKTVSDLMAYRGLGLDEALESVRQQLEDMGGSIGMIAIDTAATISMRYTGEGMYRGYVREDGEIVVEIYQGDVPATSPVHEVSAENLSPLRLAVLPFEAEPGGDAALARGLAAELAEILAYLPALVVRLPATLDEPLDGPGLEELYVDVIVRGRTFDAGDGLRVRVQLEGHERILDTAFEVSVTSDRIAELPLSLARKVTASLGAELPPERALLLERRRTGDPEAYGLFLRVLGTPPAMESDGDASLRTLERLVAKDPGFAPGHAALGERHLARGAGDLLLREVEYRRAEEALERALALDPDHPWAIAGLATLLARTGRQEEAAELLQRAIAVHPNRPELHSRLGYVLRYAGLFQESVAAYRRGLALDGRPAALVSGEGQIAKALVYMGDYSGALSLQQGLHSHLARMDRTADEKMLFYEGVMHLYAGDPLMAVDFFDEAWEADPTTVWSAFGQAYRAAAMGDTTRLLRLVQELEMADVADGERHYRLVHFYALAGREVEAVQRLRAALEGGFFAYPYVSTDPLTASLYGTPDFEAVLSDVRSRHQALRHRFAVGGNSQAGFTGGSLRGAGSR